MQEKPGFFLKMKYCFALFLSLLKETHRHNRISTECQPIFTHKKSKEAEEITQAEKLDIQVRKY